MGMAAMTRSAAKAGLCPPETVETLEGLLRAYRLPTELPYSAEALAEAARADKKAAGDRLRIVVPEAVGRCRIQSIPAGDILLWLKRGGAA